MAVCAAPVTVAADPVVFWLPVVFTPGKSISAEPSKLTPPIFLAVDKVVAVDAVVEEDTVPEIVPETDRFPAILTVPEEPLIVISFQ